MRIVTTWTNDNPDTIWNRLAKRLGREPTNAEAADEVRRILRESTIGDTPRAVRSRAARQRMLDDHKKGMARLKAKGFA